MRVDLHNHTPLCNHAQGEPEEFVARARELGIDIYGFACHAPMRFDECYRMGLADLPGYLAHIKALQAATKAAGGMEILCGLEVDFIHGKEELLESSVLDAEIDYLIGSVHFLDSWGFDNPEFIGEYAKRDIVQCWVQYLEAIAAMARSRHFQIVGHLDLLKVFGYHMPESLESKLDYALGVIAESNMSIEINAAGLRKQVGEIYPSPAILYKARKCGIPITFGSDAHSIQQVGAGYEHCIEIARNAGYEECVIYRNKHAYTLPL